MPASVLVEEVLHVFKEFDMTALVGGDGNTLHIFLDGALHYFGHRAVMTQVNDLRAFRLQESSHDIDSRVMSIEQGCGSAHSDLMAGGIAHSVNVWQAAKFTQKTNDC